MTAVEYLVSKIASKIYDEYWSNQQDITQFVEEALIMQKEQHTKTWDSAIEQHEKRGCNLMRSLSDFDEYWDNLKK